VGFVQSAHKKHGTNNPRSRGVGVGRSLRDSSATRQRAVQAASWQHDAASPPGPVVRRPAFFQVYVGGALRDGDAGGCVRLPAVCPFVRCSALFALPMTLVFVRCSVGQKKTRAERWVRSLFIFFA